MAGDDPLDLFRARVNAALLSHPLLNLLGLSGGLVHGENQAAACILGVKLQGRGGHHEGHLHRLLQQPCLVLPALGVLECHQPGKLPLALHLTHHGLDVLVVDRFSHDEHLGEKPVLGNVVEGLRGDGEGLDRALGGKETLKG